MLNKRFFLWIAVFFSILLFNLSTAQADDVILSEDFEDCGSSPWYPDNGVWQCGAPTSGPGSGHDSPQCTGTILDGNYPDETDSRLIGPTIDLPEVTGGEEIYLRFWQWFSYAGGLGCDWGAVQISVKDEDTGIWSNFATISNTIGHTSPWTKMGVELTAYAGEKVRIAFYHTARGDNSYPDYCGASSSGWFIDDIEIIKMLPEFTGDFESGWEDWGADRGVWQVGIPTAGPVECHSGLECAGTILDGNYPGNTDSRLIGPTIDLPDDCADEIYVRFWHWFSYAGGGNCDFGQLQISVWDQSIEEWSSWGNIGNKITDSSDWTPKQELLTGYAGEKVKIAFYHTARGDNSYPDYCGASSSGWLIDDIDFPGLSPVIDSTSYDEYVVPPDTSTITVTANDPCGGNLTYSWDALDGGEISGMGAQIQFAPPPEYRFCPYRVRIAVISDQTHIGSSKIAEIYTRLPGDADESGVVNVLDKVLVRNHFGQECDDPDWDPGADVNCDCVVNVLDKVLVRKYFGQSE